MMSKKMAELEDDFREFKAHTERRFVSLDMSIRAYRLEEDQRHEEEDQRHEERIRRMVGNVISHPLTQFVIEGENNLWCGNHISSYSKKRVDDFSFVSLKVGLKENYDMAGLGECAGKELCSLTIFFMKSMNKARKVSVVAELQQFDHQPTKVDDAKTLGVKIARRRKHEPHIHLPQFFVEKYQLSGDLMNDGGSVAAYQKQARQLVLQKKIMNFHRSRSNLIRACFIGWQLGYSCYEERRSSGAIVGEDERIDMHVLQWRLHLLDILKTNA
ncbi:hypothetical protein Tco_1302976 [Tanacetum coccineum]